jgi:hypothetical protein
LSVFRQSGNQVSNGAIAMAIGRQLLASDAGSQTNSIGVNENSGYSKSEASDRLRRIVPDPGQASERCSACGHATAVLIDKDLASVEERV